MRLSEKDLTPKQQAAIDFLYENDRSVMIAATGAGKTGICLTVMKELLAAGVCKRFVVACPAKVVPVWGKELGKWSHLKGLRVVALKGTPTRRSLEIAANDADVYVVSLNNLEWMLNQDHGADGIVIDELSKASGKQARKLANKREGDCFKWRCGMTATPVSQDYLKMYGMIKILDNGKALGRSKQAYEDLYFNSDYMGYNLTLRDGAGEQIMGRIRHMVHSVEDTKITDLPALTKHTMWFDMPAATREKYNEMKKDLLVDDIEAANEAVKSSKLRQLASGFIYDEFGEGIHLDHTRLDAANDWFLTCDGPAIIFYEYVAQYDQLRDRFDRGRAKATENIEDFKAGNYHILLAQINSLSHGIDGLQDVCADALFYHPVWSRDSSQQAIGRLWRTGQNHEVNITTLVCNDTLDDVVMARVEDRAEWMKLFMQHLGK